MQLRAIPLGTSAGRPTLKRGASALAVHCDQGWVLCDCGEGAQLAAQRAGLSLSRLQAVLVTHLHGDHFNGLPGLLGSLGLEGRERPLFVAGPPGIRVVLETLARYGAVGAPYPVIVVELAGEGALAWPDGLEGSFELWYGPLDHRVATFGYRVALPERPGTLDVRAAIARGVPEGPLFGLLKQGRAVTLPSGEVVTPEGLVGPPRRGSVVAYTLDTIPCESAVRLARGVDLLVHEATYEHARAALARERGHSSALEAAQIAHAAAARRLLLTHFSPSVEGEALADEARAAHEQVIAAADGVPIDVDQAAG